MTRDSRRTSVLSRFQIAAAGMIVGVAALGAGLYGLVNTHYLGLIVSRTLGPYTDALTDHGFEQSNPAAWQGMARIHGVDIVVEYPDGTTILYGADGESRAPAALPLGSGVIESRRTGPDGTRVTLRWKVLSFHESHLPLLLALVFMVGAVGGAALWFLHWQLKPLTRLHAGVEAVARGDFRVRVPVVRQDEIGDVAGAFNAMTQRVGKMIDDRERLLADVSHELRSPLARMKVALELTEPGDKRDALARDLREMESLIAALLEREVLRSRRELVAAETVDLRALAAHVAEGFAQRAPGVRVEPGSPVEVQADATLLKALLQNLIDNAVKFSKAESAPVCVEADQSGDSAVLRVLDDGVGVPAGREEEVFEPFVKLDPSRGHHVGYGLGLDLCRRIVALHGGSIELRRREPRGTEVVVSLPRSAPGPAGRGAAEA